MLRITSRSWIMRSSTTSTSVPRSTKGARRWHSRNRGRVSRLDSSRIAGLKRSRWPTCRIRPCVSAMCTRSRGLVERRGDRLLHEHVDARFEKPGTDVAVKRVWAPPRSRNRRCPRDPRPRYRHDSRSAPRPPRRERDRCRPRPTSSTSGAVAYFSAWNRPRYPTPTTAARSLIRRVLRRSSR